MGNVTDCANSRLLMMKLMDGTIAEHEELLLFQHSNDCAPCREDLEAYQSLLDGLTETGLAQAPEGFEYAVMARIALIPNPYADRENRIDTLLCVVWGCFSVSSGAGMLLFINRDGIRQWAEGDPMLAGYMNAVVPVAESAATALARFSLFIQSGMDMFMGYASSIQIVLAGIFSVLALVQFLIYRKDNVKV